MLNFPNGVTEAIFLQKYWQQQPLVLRQAFNDINELLSCEDLLQLSYQEDVESRLVIQDLHNDEYSLIHGPQSQTQLQQLENQTHWTLLVQSVNLWLPRIAHLSRHFEFIPQWRFDDIMLSYATDQGGVGPHTDEYDVFLLQISGKRRWLVGAPGSEVIAKTTSSGLCQVESYKAEIDTVLDVGDMLYLPPGTAHNGIGVGTGMTLSVGFRSPNLSELSMIVAEQVSKHDKYYREPKTTQVQKHSLEISSEAMAKAADWYKAKLPESTIQVAFGLLQTQPKQELMLNPLYQDISDYLSNSTTLSKDPCARLAWWENEAVVHIFSNGEHYQDTVSIKPLLEFLEYTQDIDLNNFSTYIEDQDYSKLISFLVDTGYWGIK